MVRPVVYFMILVVICGVLSNGARISSKPNESLSKINLANSTVGQLYVINYYDSCSIPTTVKGLSPTKNADVETEDLDIKVASERNKQLRKSTSEMKNKIRELENEVAVLKKKITSKENKIIRLEERIDSKDTTISEMQKTIIVKDAAIKDTQKIIIMKDDAIKDLQTTITKRDAMIKHLQESVVGRYTTNKDLEKIIVTKDASIKTLEKTVVIKDATIRNFTKTVERKNASIKDLQNIVKGKESTIQTQKDKIIQLKTVIKKYCVAASRWSKWSEWSPCNASCGDGTSTRARLCLQPFIGGRPCQGNATEEMSCNKNCPARNLAILFRPEIFKLKPPHKVRGEYRGWKFTFVNDSGLSSSPTFLEVKEFLNSVIVDAGPIRRIVQGIGFSQEGKKAVQGTTIDGAVTDDDNALDCCDADGKRYRRSELERTSADDFRENDGKRLLLMDGDCRTALWILDR